MKRILWGCPVKDRKKAERRLRRDLKFYGGNGLGNCAKLDERHLTVIKRQFKDGSIWYQIEVDDVLLPLEYL